ncbi:MAG: 50S ribosomal protein L17 [Desulfobacterales bacterium]|nr:50S ribosomal protein L17 [Desulfobacterales bacterium]
MRHRKATLKLGRTGSHRKAMFRNMVTSLFKYKRIKTTKIKAKELIRWADRIITLAKKGDLHSRRRALSIIREKGVVHKLFNEEVSQFKNINGGYTRVIKIGYRSTDAAPMALVEFVTGKDEVNKIKFDRVKDEIDEKSTTDNIIREDDLKEKIEIDTEDQAGTEANVSAKKESL